MPDNGGQGLFLQGLLPVFSAVLLAACTGREGEQMRAQLAELERQNRADCVK